MKLRTIYSFFVLLSVISCIKDKPTGKELAVGDILPEFTVTMNDGSIVTSDEVRQTPSCVMFFHTSCPDCRQTLPVVQEIYEKYCDKGVRFVLISREEDNASVSSYWAEHQLTLPYSAQETRDVYELFAQTKVPRIYINAQGGEIRYIHADDPLPDLDILDTQISAVCGTDKE